MTCFVSPALAIDGTGAGQLITVTGVNVSAYNGTWFASALAAQSVTFNINAT